MFKKSTGVAQETYKKRSTKLPTTEEKSSKSSPHRVRKNTTFKDDSSKTTTHTVKPSKTTTHKDKASKPVSHNDKTSKTTAHKDLSSKPSSDKTSKTSPHKDPSSETSTEHASKTTGAHKDPTDKTSTDKHSKTTIRRTRSRKVLISTHKTSKKHTSGHSGHVATKKVPAPDISPTKEKPKTWKEKNNYSLKLSEKQREDLKQTFAIFDRDRGTELSLSEMVLINNSMGLDVSNAELQGIMDSVDKDVSKTTTFGEFLEIIAQKVSDVAHRKQLIVDFRQYDAAKEGYIRKEEIRNVVRARDEPLSSAELDAMLTNVDIDDDNRVNYEELARVMTA